MDELLETLFEPKAGEEKRESQRTLPWATTLRFYPNPFPNR